MLPHQHASHQKYAQLQRPATYFVVWGETCMTTMCSGRAVRTVGLVLTFCASAGRHYLRLLLLRRML